MGSGAVWCVVGTGGAVLAVSKGDGVDAGVGQSVLVAVFSVGAVVGGCVEKMP